MKIIKWLLGEQSNNSDSRRSFFGKAAAAPFAVGALQQFEAKAKSLNTPDIDESARLARLPESIAAHPNTLSAPTRYMTISMSATSSVMRFTTSHFSGCDHFSGGWVHPSDEEKTIIFPRSHGKNG